MITTTTITITMTTETTTTTTTQIYMVTHMHANDRQKTAPQRRVQARTHVGVLAVAGVAPDGADGALEAVLVEVVTVQAHGTLVTGRQAVDLTQVVPAAGALSPGQGGGGRRGSRRHAHAVPQRPLARHLRRTALHQLEAQRTRLALRRLMQQSVRHVRWHA